MAKKEVAKIARGTPKKTAADAIGWTYEHIQALLGDEEASAAFATFINHMQGGRLHPETMLDLNTVRVTPLRKGTKGKIRPITIGATLKRFGLSAILKTEKNLQQVVSP